MKYIQPIIIAALLILAAFLMLRPTPKPTTITDYKIISIKADTVYIPYDTIIYQSKDKLVYITDTFSPLPDVIDTNKILQLYFNKNYYNDTIKFPSGNIAILDTISTNKIIGRSVNLNIKNMIIRDSILLVKKDKINIFVGPNYNPFDRTIGFQLIAEYKGFQLVSGYNNGLNIGINIKIK